MTTNSKMNNKILTYSQYLKRSKEITTPEEMAAFAKELMAPLMGTVTQSEIATIEKEAIDIPSQEKSMIVPKIAKRSPRNPYALEQVSPWYDVAGNDTEAMVIDLYAKGLTTRDIVNHLKRSHNIEISQPTVSNITDKVFPLVKEWQSRPLSSCYPIVYLDGMHFKVRDSGKIASKVAFIALGINQYGQKEVLGIWISETEGAKFWMHVLNDIKNRGVDDILITCVDGLKSFPDAIKAMYPHTDVQVCVVHQIRHTVMFIASKDKDQFCDQLKSVYQAPSEDAGRVALNEMMERWPQYRAYLKSWETRWADIAPFFSYPQAVRKTVYTTNAVENLNRQFRKVTKTTQIFPHDDALLKLLWLAQADITQSWTLSTRNWAEVMAQLSIMFPDRVHF
jgi:putative transposase